MTRVDIHSPIPLPASDAALLLCPFTSVGHRATEIRVYHCVCARAQPIRHVHLFLPVCSCVCWSAALPKKSQNRGGSQLLNYLVCFERVKRTRGWALFVT